MSPTDSAPSEHRLHLYQDLAEQLHLVAAAETTRSRETLTPADSLGLLSPHAIHQRHGTWEKLIYLARVMDGDEQIKNSCVLQPTFR